MQSIKQAYHENEYSANQKSQPQNSQRAKEKKKTVQQHQYIIALNDDRNSRYLSRLLACINCNLCFWYGQTDRIQIDPFGKGTFKSVCMCARASSFIRLSVGSLVRSPKNKCDHQQKEVVVWAEWLHRIVVNV